MVGLAHQSLCLSYLEFSHKLILQQLVISLERGLCAALLVLQGVETNKVDAQSMNLSFNVGGLGDLATDLRLDTKLLLRQYRVLVSHQLDLGRLLVVLLT